MRRINGRDTTVYLDQFFSVAPKPLPIGRLVAMAHRHGETLESVFMRSRTWNMSLTRARRAVFAMLHDDGWSLRAIARWCGRDYQNIGYTLGQSNKAKQRRRIE